MNTATPQNFPKPETAVKEISLAPKIVNPGTADPVEVSIAFAAPFVAVKEADDFTSKR